MGDQNHKLAQDEMLQLLVEQAQEHALILLDPAGEVVSWLGGARRIFGYVSDEIMGRAITNLFSREDIEKGIPEWELKVASENGAAEDDRWMVAKDGLRFWATGALIPLRRNGELIAFAKILRNRTDLKVQMATVEQELKSLRQAEERRSTFVATLAHELRNPLSAILSAAELAQLSEAGSEDSAPALGSIKRAVKNMRRLVDDLMDEARLHTGKMEPTGSCWI